MSIAQSNFNHSNNSTLQDFFPFETRPTYSPNSWADMMDQEDAETLEQQIREKLQSWYDIINAPENIQKSKTTKKRNKKNQEWMKVEKTKKIKTVVDEAGAKNAHSETTLILKGLPYDQTEDEDLKRRFEHYGPIRFITVLRNKDGSCKGLAFVRFINPTSVDILLRGTRHFMYNGRKVIIERTK